MPPYNLETYFEEAEISGMPLFRFQAGTVSIPTGDILVRDPLVWLRRDEAPYFIKVPAGEFPVTIAAVRPKDDAVRYAAVKVAFTGQRSVRQEEALIGHENLDGLEDGSFFGFNVDAGLAAIVDLRVRDAYCDFSEQFHREHPDGNMYDDYFAELFVQSYQAAPALQRSGGDWIAWTIPGTNYQMPIFATGFGDGTYPVYLGYDENGAICSLFIQFIDIELAYGEEPADESSTDQ